MRFKISHPNIFIISIQFVSFIRSSLVDIIPKHMKFIQIIYIFCKYIDKQLLGFAFTQLQTLESWF